MRSSPVNNYTGYDAINYFQSDDIAKRLLKMPPPMASGRVTFLQNSSSEAELFGSLPAIPALLSYVQYLSSFSSRPEATIGIVFSVLSSRIVGPIVPYRRVNFRDLRLNRSGEIQRKAVGCGIFGNFSITTITADRK